MNNINKILILCFFAAIFSPSGIDLYVALIPTITISYGENAELALSSYILGMAIGTLFSGFLYDKYGGRNLLLFSSVFLIFTCISLYSTDDFSSLVIIRLIQGIVISPFMLCALSIIKDNLSADKIGSSYAKINGFMNLIPMMMPMLSVFILEYTGSWQSVFLFLAILSLMFLIYLLITFKTDTIKWEKEKNIPFLEIMKNKNFLEYSIYPILSLALIFMYCAFSPTVITLYMEWDIYSYIVYFGFNGILMFIVGQSLGIFFERYGSKGVLIIGLKIAILSSLIVAFSTLYSELVIVGLSLYSISFIMIIASSHDLSLSGLKFGIGKANGIISGLQMILGATLSALVAIFSSLTILLIFSSLVFSLGVFGITKIKGNKN